MAEIHEGSEVVRGARGAIRHDAGGFFDGVVHTPHGTVAVGGYVDRGRFQIIRLETVRDGRMYYHWERRPASRVVTDRGLKTVARRWAAGLVGRLERSESDASM